MIPWAAVGETVTSFCRICEALCGMELDVDEARERVVAIRPDRAHVVTQGFACIKGLRQHELYQSPDRLREPLRREGGRLRPTTWERALGEIGERVRAIRSRHHPDAIAMYVGTAAGFSILHPVFAQGFMQGLGSRSSYSSATQDCSNKFAVANLLYGFPFLQAFPDVDRTRCLVVVGANPAVSKWSFLQDGALVDVSTEVATIRLPVEACRDLMPGTVAVPHGWGHQRAKGLSVAGRTQGVNVNLLSGDGPQRLDPVSGMARLTGIGVRVRPAAGPRDESDWSGVPTTE